MQKHGRLREQETVVDVATVIFYLGDGATEATIVNQMFQNYGLSETSTKRALRTLRDSGALISKGYSVGKRHSNIKQIDLEHVLFSLSYKLIKRDMAIFSAMQDEDIKNGSSQPLIPPELWNHYIQGTKEQAKINASYEYEAIRIARESGSDLALFLASLNAARFIGDYVKNWKKEKQPKETEAPPTKEELQNYEIAILARASPVRLEETIQQAVNQYLDKKAGITTRTDLNVQDDNTF